MQYAQQAAEQAQMSKCFEQRMWMRFTRHRLQAAVLASGLLQRYGRACIEQALLSSRFWQVNVGCCQGPLASGCVGRTKSGLKLVL